MKEQQQQQKEFGEECPAWQVYRLLSQIVKKNTIKNYMRAFASAEEYIWNHFSCVHRKYFDMVPDCSESSENGHVCE